MKSLKRKLYIEAFKTLHESGGKPYTERYMEAFKTLPDSVRKPCTNASEVFLK